MSHNLKLKELEWDSSFFGYPIAKVTIVNNQFDFHQFEQCAIRYKLLYVFSKEKLTHSNLKLVDQKVEYAQDITQRNNLLSLTNNIKEFDTHIHDIEELVSLALESGIYSRFKIDDNFKNNEYYRLYKEWTLNSINYNLAFTVQVYVEENKILGFLTLSKLSETTADIGLVAVHKEARGKGVATKLINKAIDIAKEKGFEKLRVVTQSNNKPACNLYLKAGFKPINKTFIYHYWNL